MDDLAFQKVKAMMALLKTCSSKKEAEECFRMMRDLTDYVKLPNEAIR